jgi:hypothetical protein
LPGQADAWRAHQPARGSGGRRDEGRRPNGWRGLRSTSAPCGRCYPRSTTDFAQTLDRQHALQRALEARLGRPADWPLKIQAAYQQLQTLQGLIGDDYATFIRYAEQAVQERDENIRQMRLGRLLFDKSDELPDPLQIGWAMSFGLEVLLNKQEYALVIGAAAEAVSVHAATH